MSIRIIFFCYCITPLVCLAERNVSAQLKDGWIIVAQGNDENFQQVKVKVWGADRIAGKFYQLDADPEKEFVVMSRGIGTGPYYKLQEPLAKPFFGRPRFLGAFFAVSFLSGFSRASIAVESRELWPTSSS